MNSRVAGLLALCFLATTAQAQSKRLDKAIAKAHEEVQQGKPADAVRTLTKAAAEEGPPGQVALGRLHERLGDLDAAEAAYGRAKSRGQDAETLAAVAEFTLRTGSARDALAIARQALAEGATPAALAAEARALVRTDDGPGALVAADKALAAGGSSAMPTWHGARR